MNIDKLCMGCMRDHNTIPCEFCNFDLDRYMKKLSAHILRPQTILNGKYMLGKLLGEGGFGITYIGIDLNIGAKLAIKEYYPSGYARRNCNQNDKVSRLPRKDEFNYDKGLEKFLQEAKNVAKFNKANGIVRVIDFFRENGTAYMVMEFIDGMTLNQYMKKNGGKIDCIQSVNMMLPVIETLSLVHSAGMIHRDISPENIMIDEKGNMKLIDFGAAREFLTKENKSKSILLKPGYAPEEQYMARGDQGPWTDVYALCATLYRMITGVTPVESIERGVNDTLRPIVEFDHSIPKEISDTIQKGMAVSKKNRIHDMKQLHKILSKNLKSAKTSNNNYSQNYAQNSQYPNNNYSQNYAQNSQYPNNNYSQNYAQNSQYPNNNYSQNYAQNSQYPNNNYSQNYAQNSQYPNNNYSQNYAQNSQYPNNNYSQNSKYSNNKIYNKQKFFNKKKIIILILIFIMIILCITAYNLTMHKTSDYEIAENTTSDTSNIVHESSQENSDENVQQKEEVQTTPHEELSLEEKIQEDMEGVDSYSLYTIKIDKDKEFGNEILSINSEERFPARGLINMFVARNAIFVRYYNRNPGNIRQKVESIMSGVDNESVNYIIDELGGVENAINPIYKILNLTQTHLGRRLGTSNYDPANENITCAQDAAKLLYSVYKAKLSGRIQGGEAIEADYDNVDDILYGMRNIRDFKNGIYDSSNYSPDVTVYTKVGVDTQDGIYNEASIIDTPKGAYLLVIMSKNPMTTDEFSQLPNIRQVAKDVYEEFIKY